jgi:Protein of unknown function (DUF3159)
VAKHSRQAQSFDQHGDPLAAALGGKRGMAEVGVPGLIFVTAFTFSHQLVVAVWAAVAVAGILTVIRLVRRETPKHAFGGFMGVAICAFFALMSGKAENFFLPGLIYNTVNAVVFAFSMLVRWPLLGVTLGPILGENFTWRRVPGRMTAYMRATAVLLGVFLIRLLVLWPLYWAHQITALGVAKTIVTLPLWAAGLYVAWLILSKAPPPMKVEVPHESGPLGTEAPTSASVSPIAMSSVAEPKDPPLKY